MHQSATSRLPFASATGISHLTVRSAPSCSTACSVVQVHARCFFLDNPGCGNPDLVELGEVITANGIMVKIKKPTRGSDTIEDGSSQKKNRRMTSSNVLQNVSGGINEADRKHCGEAAERQIGDYYGRID